VISGIAIGGGVGAVIARRVPMTSMPELVAAFHSLVGMAAVLVAAGAFYAPEAFGIGKPGQIHAASLVEMSLGVAIGALTFSGSVIAFLKLSGRMSGAPIILRGVTSSTSRSAWRWCSSSSASWSPASRSDSGMIARRSG